MTLALTANDVRAGALQRSSVVCSVKASTVFISTKLSHLSSVRLLAKREVSKLGHRALRRCVCDDN
jgi:hypothetical protein